MREIEVNLADVRPETVDRIVDAMAETIEGLGYLNPSVDEIIVAVGEVFQALVEGEAETLH